jgi:hypothetical protein
VEVAEDGIMLETEEELHIDDDWLVWPCVVVEEEVTRVRVRVRDPIQEPVHDSVHDPERVRVRDRVDVEPGVSWLVIVTDDELTPKKGDCEGVDVIELVIAIEFEPVVDASVTEDV